MIDAAHAFRRALTGEHVPELPAAARVNIARMRERLRSELPALYLRAAAERMDREAFEEAWAEAVNRIMDEAETSLRMACAQ